jgi:hypothetical protein
MLTNTGEEVILTIKQVVDYLNVMGWMIYRFTVVKKIPAVKVGGM